MAEAAGLVLGLDTSTAVVVGLARSGTVLTTAVLHDTMAHVEQLIPLVREICREAQVTPAQIDRIVVGLGPGPFTGLRVGVVTAQVLAMALDRPWQGVCSLDVLAAEHARADPVGSFLVATDARRHEVYWARYDRHGRRLSGPSVNRPADVPREPTVGPGVELYPALLAGVPGPRALDPATLAVAGPLLPAAGRLPLYLRRPDVTQAHRPKSVLARSVLARPDRRR